jgi:hypothetical protein
MRHEKKQERVLLGRKKQAQTVSQYYSATLVQDTVRK